MGNSYHVSMSTCILNNCLYLKKMSNRIVLNTHLTLEYFLTVTAEILPPTEETLMTITRQ